MTHADSALQVCTRVQGREATSLAFSAITQNKTPRNLLPMKNFQLSCFQKCAKFYTHENF